MELAVELVDATLQTEARFFVRIWLHVATIHAHTGRSEESQSMGLVGVAYPHDLRFDTLHTDRVRRRLDALDGEHDVRASIEHQHLDAWGMRMG